MNHEVRVDCHACRTIRCKEYKVDYNIKTIIGLDGSMCFNYPEPVLQCEVLRGSMTEADFLRFIGWESLIFTLKDIQKEESRLARRRAHYTQTPK